MSTETWIIILGISGVNLTTFIGGLIHIIQRLTRIETDIKWIKQGCPRCPQNSDPPST